MSAADDLAGSLVTVNDARASLGVTALWIKKAYQRAADMTIGGPDRDWNTPVDPDAIPLVNAPLVPQQQAAAIELLDQLNTYAQAVYAELDAQPGSDPVGDLGRQRTALAFRQAEHAFTLIDQQARDIATSPLLSLLESWLAAAKAVIVGIAKGAEYVLKTAAQVAASVLSPLQSTLLSVIAIVVAGGVVYLLARRAIS